MIWRLRDLELRGTFLEELVENVWAGVALLRRTVQLYMFVIRWK